MIESHLGWHPDSDVDEQSDTDELNRLMKKRSAIEVQDYRSGYEFLLLFAYFYLLVNVNLGL